MNPRQIVILGSTGSIGKSALDVVSQHPDRLKLKALAAHSNDRLLAEQYRQFRPDILCLVDTDAAKRLQEKLSDEPVTIVAGEEELINLTRIDSVDLVLNAVVGAAGLKASLETVKQGKLLALANKESLVAGGPLFASLNDEANRKILPVDSEHSAIWQSLRSGNKNEVHRIILTSSGGPFRTWPAEKLKEVTVEQALNHPTWNMGPKITIDSATLANKGLEVIEAVYLFNLAPKQIEVVVHPQSVVHSMVEFVDSSIIAQLSLPDMRLPISYALFYPERVESPYGRIDWRELSELTFEPPDLERFPALKLAFEAVQSGGTAPAIYNAANEEAVSAFLSKRIRFVEIADILAQTLNSIDIVTEPCLGDIIEADSQARKIARQVSEKVA